MPACNPARTTAWDENRQRRSQRYRQGHNQPTAATHALRTAAACIRYASNLPSSHLYQHGHSRRCVAFILPCYPANHGHGHGHTVTSTDTCVVSAMMATTCHSFHTCMYTRCLPDCRCVCSGHAQLYAVATVTATAYPEPPYMHPLTSACTSTLMQALTHLYMPARTPAVQPRLFTHPHTHPPAGLHERTPIARTVADITV